MAEENEENGSWTAFPSLLPSLSTSQQEALEDAACAHHCGRYHDADTIFESRLPPSHTIPILALQHADMLSSSGREHQRIEVLENTLATLSFEDGTENPCLEALLMTMLAEAKFFALGHAPMEENSKLLHGVRVQLRGRNLESMSDLEIRCIVAYYDFVSVLEIHTNFVGRSDHTILEDRNHNKLFETKIDELRELVRILQIQQRWQLMPRLMQVVVKHAQTGTALKSRITEAISLCSIIEGERHPGVRYGSIIIKCAVADMLDNFMPSLAVTIRQEIVETLEQMCDSNYSQWQDFCPIVSSYMQRVEACGKENHTDEKLSTLRSLAEAAEERNDFRGANELYIAWHDEAKACLDGLKNEDDSRLLALERLRRIQEALIYFHRGRTRSIYFLGSTLVNYLSNLYVNYPLSAETAHLIDEFLHSYPDFSIPLLLERIYGLGVNATSKLGQGRKRGHFQSKHLEWTSKCPFWEARSYGLTEQSILDPTQTLRKVHGKKGDLITWGTNVLRLLLLWISHEWETGQLTTEEAKALVGPSVGNFPRGNIGEYLRDLEISRFEKYIFGTTDDVNENPVFLVRYRRLQDWALVDGRLPNRSSRLYAMSVLLQSRIARIARYRDDHPDNTEERQADTEEVYEQLSQLNALQTQELTEFEDLEEKVFSGAIHLTLFRSSLDDPVARGLISDNELQLRISDCRRLFERYRHQGNLILEYQTLIQSIRLIWQRHIHFQELAEALLPIAEEANRVFMQIQNLILAKDAPKDIIAQAKVSKEFQNKDHFSYALPVSLTTLDIYLAQYLALQKALASIPQDLEAKVWQNYGCFLRWSLRVKESDFVDLLSLESGTAESVRVNGDVYRPFRQEPVDETRCQKPASNAQKHIDGSSPEGQPNNDKMAMPHQIVDMLQSLPDNAVILDFVNLNHPQSSATQIVAVVYRKEQMATILKIPVLDMNHIEDWVKKYIETPQKQDLESLGRGEGNKSLEELANLLSELTGPAEYLPSGHTLIICPTGSLNQVPLHAIPVGVGDSKQPLIKRNPIIYCQSLTALHEHWQWLTKDSKLDYALEGNVRGIKPMEESWKTKEKFISTLWPIRDQDRTDLSSALHTELTQQEKIKREHDEATKPQASKGLSSYFKLLSSCFGEANEPDPDSLTTEKEEVKFLGDALDMAQLMRNVVIASLHDADQEDSPTSYQWAAVTINAFWLSSSHTSARTNVSKD